MPENSHHPPGSHAGQDDRHGHHGHGGRHDPHGQEGHDDSHGHGGQDSQDDGRKGHRGRRALVLRPNSGISGDILVAGLARVAGASQADLDEAVAALGFPGLRGRVRVAPRALGPISGWGLELELPPEHAHRKLGDILDIFGKASIPEKAKALAARAFGILAAAEGQVHGIDPSEVTFHEVGALDSILDTGLAAALFARIDPDLFVCGPLPLCDGTIRCAHGLLASPAPAVSILLEGAAVRGIESSGETVTPTGIALLKAFGARFGPWPEMTVEAQALVFGTRALPGVPNGALFAVGAQLGPGYKGSEDRP
jgi:uncharacterized protein (DUF111 family)